MSRNGGYSPSDTVGGARDPNIAQKPPRAPVSALDQLAQIRYRVYTQSNTAAGARNPEPVHPNSTASAATSGEHGSMELSTLPSTNETAGHPSDSQENSAASRFSMFPRSSDGSESVTTILHVESANPHSKFIPSNSQTLSSSSGYESMSPVTASNTDSGQGFPHAHGAHTSVTDDATMFPLSNRQEATSSTPNPGAGNGGAVVVPDAGGWRLSQTPTPNPHRPRPPPPAHLALHLNSLGTPPPEPSDSSHGLSSQSASEISQPAARPRSPMAAVGWNPHRFRGRLSLFRPSPTSTAASTVGLLSDGSNSSDIRRANSLASLVDDSSWSCDLLQPGTHFLNRGHNRFDTHSNENFSLSNQNVSFPGGPDRVLASGGGSVSFDSHTESLSEIDSLPRPSPDTGDAAIGVRHTVPKPEALIGPVFDASAFQSPQPLTFRKLTPRDVFVCDIQGGLWRISPHPLFPDLPPPDLTLLTPERLATALRYCQDEHDMNIGGYNLMRIIDLSNLQYVDEWNNHLECGICLNPFVEPLTTPCNHTFCKECLARAVLDRRECPKCRSPRVHPVEMIFGPKVIENMVDDMKVRCPLRTRGCEQIISRSDVVDHVKHHCGYLLLACPSRQCAILIPRKDRHPKVCRHRMAECQHCKQFRCPKVDLAIHITEICPEYKVKCPDCAQRFSRRLLRSHISTCPNAMKPCMAKVYGCDFMGEAGACGEHERACPLVKLTPWLKTQEQAIHNRLKTLEQAIHNLQKAIHQQHQQERVSDSVDQFVD